MTVPDRYRDPRGRPPTTSKIILECLEDGEWHPYHKIAGYVGVSSKAGSFRSAIYRLRKAGKIERRWNGYRGNPQAYRIIR